MERESTKVGITQKWEQTEEIVTENRRDLYRRKAQINTWKLS
jgi:hypothetical protein